MKKKLDVGSSGYFNFNIPNDIKENPHFFCGEELLTPFVPSCDSQRLNLFSNHVAQTVHLVNPEFPRVFTGFENQIGEYSVAYKKAEKDFTIIAKIPKNALTYTLVVKYRNGKYDCIDVNRAFNISEDYGYGLNDCLANKEVGDTVKEGEFIYKSDNYDEDGNFSYGVNLKSVYLPWYGKTYEDGFVITESGAKKLASYKVEKTTVSINTNDILLNLYAKDGEYMYHSIPKVGESTHGGVLVVSRREESQNILYNFQLNRMKEIDWSNDQIYYTCGGIVTDINIYSNASLEKLKNRNNEFAREVANLYEEQLNYYKELADTLDKIIPPLTEEEYISRLDASEKKLYDAEKKEYGHYYVRPLPKEENPNDYTDELGYKWKYAHEYIDGRISWRSDGKRFDNFKIEFTIMKENPLTVGSKCTGRWKLFSYHGVFKDC